MQPWIVRNLLLPAHERLFRRRTFACLAELERTQWLPAPTIRRLQSDKLRATLLHADRRVPFYRSRFHLAGFDPARLNSPADLQSLPILTKADIRANLDSMTWAGVPGGLHRCNTGGSTGEPLQFFVDRRRQACDQAARMLTHRWFDAQVGEREVYLWGAPVELRRQDRLRAWRDRLTNQLLLSAFELSPEHIEAYGRRIRQYNPSAVFGYPSTLALLSRHWTRRGRTLRGPRLRRVFVTGEMLTPQDRADISACFGVPVANGYGSRDGGFIAHECPHGAMHVMDHNLVVEIVDESGRPAAPGDLGRLIITQLDNDAMPLIRYDTGDLARLADPRQSCPCGRNFSQLQSVAGRATDLLVAPDGTVRHALAAIYVLRDEPAIQRYRILQFADHSITIEIVCPRDLDHATQLRLLAGLHQRLGSDLRIRLERVQKIGTTSSGKFRPVVSMIPTGLLHADPAARSRRKSADACDSPADLDATAGNTDRPPPCAEPILTASSD